MDAEWGITVIFLMNVWHHGWHNLAAADCNNTRHSQTSVSPSCIDGRGQIAFSVCSLLSGDVEFAAV